MTDRELLERAARAIGKELTWSQVDGVWPLLRHGPGIRGIGDKWNPLEDDGDALRLAVELGIDVSFERDHTFVGDISGDMLAVRHGDNRHAATRRAIVMAAAEVTM